MTSNQPQVVLANPIPKAATKKNRTVVVPDDHATEEPKQAPDATGGCDEDRAFPRTPSPPPGYDDSTPEPFCVGYGSSVVPPEYEKVEYTEVKPSRSPNKRMVWFILGVSVAVALLVGLITGITLYVLSANVQVGWGSWGEWSACDVTCGQGWMTRSRECRQDRCAGSAQQVAQCSMPQCPLPEVPVWGSWQAWSECSVTCGAGQQTRSRTCQSEECPGDTAQARSCPGWSCPDCSDPCPGGGQWNASCTWCECPGQELTGRVLSSVSTPLPGVLLLPARAPYADPLALTDARGEFRVPGGACVGQVLLLQKEGYVDRTHEVTGTTEEISLIKIEPLRVTTHPESKQRLVGEEASLCCTAIGSPPPDYYEWFRDGELVRTDMTSGSSVLVLDNLQEAQEGEYRCRANNDYSAVFSEAVMVQVKASPSAYCSPYPLSHVVALPVGCTTVDGARSYDVGRCQELPCQHPAANRSSTCRDPQAFCCGATATARVEMVCEDGAPILFEVTGCGCAECPTGGVQISGYLQAADTLDPIAFAQVRLQSGLSVYADASGHFSLTLSTVQRRVALTASDVNGEYIDNTVVVYITDPSGVTSVNVRLMRRADPVEVDTAGEMFLPMGGGGSNRRAPFAGIRIPPGSVFTANGTVFTGNARARLNVIDPREVSQIENSPSDFMYVNEEGESMLLDTFGMFYLQVEDAFGNPLQVQGDVEISLDAALAGDIIPNLYSLDADGQWVYEVSMRKAQATGVYSRYFSSVIIGNVTVPVTEGWVNVDSSTGYSDFCVSKIRLYETDEYVREIRGARPSVVITGRSTAQRYSRLFQTQGGYCIPHPCDVTYNYNYKGYVLVEYDGKQASPVSDDNLKDHGIKDEQLKQRISYKSLGDSISVDLSYYKQRPAIGPFYTYKKAYSYDCDVASSSEHHFRFHQNSVAETCGNTEDFRVLECPTGVKDNINYYAWYPDCSAEAMYTVVFIKVAISGSRPTMLQAISSVGNNTRGGVQVGDQYGYSMECKDEYEAVCLEVKASGMVSDGVDAVKDETMLRVQTVREQSREFCTGYRINPAMNDYVKHPTPDFVASHRFDLGLTETYFGQYSFQQGVYAYVGGDLEYVRRRARRGCETGTNALGTPPAGDAVNKDNSAIEFFC